MARHAEPDAVDLTGDSAENGARQQHHGVVVGSGAQASTTARASAAAEEAELYFLIANFLTHASPCSRAAAVLQEELVSMVLPCELTV